MTDRRKITRRSAIQLGLGAAAGGAAGKLLPFTAADDCETPSQAEGPFYPIHEQADRDLDLTHVRGRSDKAEGDIVYIHGQVLGDDLKPVPNALVDVWQANARGRYAHEADPNPAPLDDNFQGWGQVRTDTDGHYSLKTIVPGAYPAADDWWRPPHIHFKVSRRGYHELITQMYFAGESLNDDDALLQTVPEAERERLVVDFVEGHPDDEPGSRRGVFNIVLRRVQRG